MDPRTTPIEVPGSPQGGIVDPRMAGRMRPPTIDELPLEGLWQNFGVFKADELFPMGYPQNIRRVFAPIDNVHGAIVAFCNASRVSLASAMYGWDDDEIDELFRNKLETDHIPVQLSLDKTQAAGVHEKELLKRWSADQIGNSVAIGHSSKGAISHTKLIVIDGIVTIQGSTNLSASGEDKQNNECTFVLDPVFATETRARIDKIHDEMLMQMQRSK